MEQSLGRIVFALIATLFITTVPAGAAPDASTVPTVACASDGQIGPVPAQKSDAGPTLVGPKAAKLAYYAAQGLRVLAPLGWHCFGLYGSSGSTVIVTPEQHGDDLLTSTVGLRGAAVQLSIMFGDTSGRFKAAEIAARLFPSRRTYVEGVVAEGIEPRSSFHFGPFPDDTIRRFGDDVVEFETPPTKIGMGTNSRLIPNSDPIRGLAMITPRNNVLLLTIRLPKTQRDLVTTIIDTVRESKKSFEPE